MEGQVPVTGEEGAIRHKEVATALCSCLARQGMQGRYD